MLFRSTQGLGLARDGRDGRLFSIRSTPAKIKVLNLTGSELNCLTIAPVCARTGRLILKQVACGEAEDQFGSIGPENGI